MKTEIHFLAVFRRIFVLLILSAIVKTVNAQCETGLIGWWGDSPANTPNGFIIDGITGCTASPMTAGPGATVANVTENGASIFRVGGLTNNTSFATALTNNDYMKATVTIASGYNIFRISSARVRSVGGGTFGASSGAFLFGMTIVNNTTGVATTVFSGAAVADGATSQPAVAPEYDMMPGNSYEVRWYFYGLSGGSQTNTRGIDNPILFYKAVPNVINNNVSICTNQTVDLTTFVNSNVSTASYGNQWFTNATQTAPYATPTAAGPGTYYLAYHDNANNCNGPSSVAINIIGTTPVTPSFTSIGPLCVGATSPTLPTSSNDTPPITGTWNATTAGTASAGTTVYTFTPTAGQCANSTTLSVTVNANTTPTFNPLANVCVGATAPVLPTTSSNGITGTWNASPSTAAAGTFTFTFTPTSGTCVTTATIQVTVIANTTPTFPALANVCVGAPAPTLPATSNEGISGNWNATPSTAAAGTFTFTFTPTSGTCVTTATIQLTVVANTTPTFPALANVCVGAPAPTLPPTSNEGISGNWNATPSTAATGTFTFTFTPTSGTCVTTATIQLTVVANTTPTFPALANVCVGAPAPTLPATSNEGISGNWNATPSTAAAGTFTFTFTPTSGTCVTTTTIQLTVVANTTPTFPALANVCVGAPAPTLPTSSNEGITGTWNAAPSTAAAGTFTFTFTPTSGTCVTTATISLTVVANTTPTFTPLANVCVGAPAPTLPASSNEGISGTWNAAPSTAAAGTFTFTFTPTSGTCVTTATISLTVVANTTPTFTPLANVCIGDPAPTLPPNSNEGISGTWNAAPSTATAGTFTFTFTPTSGTCVTTATISLTVTDNITPTFPVLASVCLGDPAPTLPPTSNEGISGTWNAAPSTAATGTFTFTFTPTSGTCVTTATISFTVTGNVVPTFAPLPNVCEDSAPAPTFPPVSIEGVTGTWNADPVTSSPGTFTFTFTPSAGGCQSTTTIALTVDPAPTPTFTPLADVCQGDTAPVLPTSSNDSPVITGTWDSAPSTAAAGTFTYTFTPTPGECATTTTLQLTVNPAIVPTFTPPGNECIGGPAPTLPTTSGNGITGSWNSAPSTAATGTFTFTFTPDAGQCATTATTTFTVDPNPTISVPSRSTCAGIPVTLTASGADTYTWGPTTNLTPPSGVGSTMSANPPATETYTITGTDVNGCVGTTNATVTISSALTISVTPSNPTICAGQCVTLTATGGTNYTWTGTGVTPTNAATVSACPAATTTYTVDGETSGCTGSTTVTVTVGPPATPTFAAIGPLCSGSAAPTLPTSSTNSPAITGTWNSTTASTASAGATTYTFTPDPTECATTTTMSITVNSAPTVSGVIETCNAANTQYTVEVTLSGGTPATYSVTGGTGTFAGNVWTSTPITSGTPYNFNFDDASGCGPVNVSGVKNCNCSTFAGTMNTAPQNLCQADVANATHNGNENLDGNDALSFVLHSGSGTSVGTVYATSSTPSFSYTAALTFGTTYYISAIAGDDNGSGGVVTTDPCLSVATGTPVVWNATPVATPANNGPLCEGQTLNLTSNLVAGGSYNWTGPNGPVPGIQNPSIASVTPADGGVYSLTITANGCPSATATTTVVVNAQTIPTFGALASVCQGAAAPGLPPTSGEGIPGSWNGTPSSASAGIQTFTFTPSAGQCATTTSLSFTVNPLPIANAGQDDAICPGLPKTLCGSGGGTYSWTGGITDCQSFTPMSTQTYTLTVTDANGCQDTDQVTITVYQQPVITATANPTSACLGESILFTGGGGVNPYMWDNGVTNNSPFTPTAAGTVTYNVVAQDANGCPGTASVNVTIFALPTVDAGPDQSVCPGEEVTLAGSGAVTYTWDAAVNNVPFVPSEPQTYTLTGTDANGCVDTDQVFVDVATPPTADFGINQIETTVSEPLFIFTNQSTGATTYFWDFGDGIGTSTAIDPTYEYTNTPATYTVWLYVTSTEGCQDSTHQTVQVKDELVFWVPNTFTPDGDERNNTFQPVFSSGFDPYNFTMYIYNRWGEVIFETHDVTVGWDGTYDGKMVQEGIYTWTIKGKMPQNDKKFESQGHVLIIR